MILEIYKTLSGKFACCEVDSNGEKHSFVYGDSEGEAVRRKGKKLEQAIAKAEK